MSWGNGSDKAPDPQPGDLWSTSKGRTVEILARDQVTDEDNYPTIDVIAYKFLGGSMVHIRSVDSTRNWQRVVAE